MIPIKDLRVGDLVKVTEGAYEFKKEDICEVRGIDSRVNLALVQKNDVERLRWLSIERIEGITLTSEILEKNGWEQKYYAPLIYGHVGSGVEIYLLTLKRFSVFLNDISLRVIQYVHELQHILWALGEDANLKI